MILRDHIKKIKAGDLLVWNYGKHNQTKYKVISTPFISGQLIYMDLLHVASGHKYHNHSFNLYAPPVECTLIKNYHYPNKTIEEMYGNG